MILFKFNIGRAFGLQQLTLAAGLLQVYAAGAEADSEQSNIEDSFDNLRFELPNCTESHCANSTNRTENETEEWHVHYYPPEYIVVAMSSYCAILLAGIVGNVLVCLTVSCLTRMWTPTNFHLFSLALADLLLLASAPLPSAVNLFYSIDEFIFGDAGCRATVFLSYVGANVSVLTVVSFTVERYIAICYPMRARSLCTVRRSIRIIMVIWIFGLLYSAPWLYMAGVIIAPESQRPLCTVVNLHSLVIWLYWTDFVLLFACPLLISAVLYTLIGWRLVRGHGFPSTAPSSIDSAHLDHLASTDTCHYQVKHLLRNHTAPKNVLSPPSPRSSMLRSRHSRRSMATHQRRHTSPAADMSMEKKLRRLTKTNFSSTSIMSNRSLKNKEIIKMLIVVVILFTVLCCPYRILVVYGSMDDYMELNIWTLFLARTLYFANSAVNPIVYSLMSRKFRQACRDLLQTCPTGLKGEEIVSSRQVTQAGRSPRLSTTPGMARHASVAVRSPPSPDACRPHATYLMPMTFSPGANFNHSASDTLLVATPSPSDSFAV